MALCLALPACASQSPFATALSLPDDPPHPPGVAVEKPAAAEQPVGSGNTASQQLVLHQPVPAAALRRTVRSFFEAIANRKAHQLARLMRPGARQQDLASGRTENAHKHWRRRIAKLDYSVVQGVPLVPAGPLTTHVPGPPLSGRPRPLLRPEGDEVVTVVQPTVTAQGRQVLFGEQLWLRLERGPKGYQITEIAERVPSF